jgi:hypothetical protein
MTAIMYKRTQYFRKHICSSWQMKVWGVTHTTGSYTGSSSQLQDNHLSNYIHILSAEEGTY